MSSSIIAEDDLTAELGRSGLRARLRRPRSLATAATIALVVAAGFALTVAVFQPGFATDDARYLYQDAQAWQLGDWQSPVMAVLWLLIDPLAPGATSMFLLIAALYWAAFGLLALIAARRSRAIGLAVPLLALAPPAFVLVGIIWRDILFGTVWLMAAVLTFAVAEQPPRIRRPVQGLSLALIALGLLVRPNALFAAPILAAYVLWPSRLALRRAALLFVPATIAFYALVPAVYYGVLGAKRLHPIQAIMVYDLGGITHFTGENQFPVEWSPQQAALLKQRCYSPSLWDVYWTIEPCAFVMQRLERKDDPIFGTPRLPEAWQRAVLAHPLAYLAHRTAFMWNFLARPNVVLPYFESAGPDAAAYAGRPAFQRVLAVHAVLQPTVLFRVGLWLALAGLVGAAAWPVRTAPPGAFAIAVTASAAVYVMTFFAVGVASDFRYAYWCVLATLAGAVAALLGWRERHQP
jgi:hypothetical protein